MNVVIIGGGPAGATAAIYAVRGGLNVTLINQRGGALLKAHHVDNFYGFENGIVGSTLYDEGLAQASRLGVKIIEGEVTSVLPNADSEDYVVQSSSGAFLATAVVIACGAGRLSLPILGLTQFEGKGVSSCAICDGFFYRNKRVAVIGAGKYALEEAEILTKTAASVTLLTNGQILSQTNLTVEKTKIKEILGENGRVTGVKFADERILPFDGVFIALGVASSAALATKLGIMTNDGHIVVDEVGRTNIPNVFAAGDCVGGLKQISAAVNSGTLVGLELIKSFKNKK